MESVWPISKLSTESVGSRRELVTNCVHTADADATKQFRRAGVGGAYIVVVLLKKTLYLSRDFFAERHRVMRLHNIASAMLHKNDRKTRKKTLLSFCRFFADRSIDDKNIDFRIKNIKNVFSLL